LEAAQDAFVIALRRLRALEEVAAQLRAPLDLEHAHQLWSRIAHAPALPPQAHAGGRARLPDNIDDELRATRASFNRAREALQLAEAAAARAA
jgi:hypothetical protein